MEANKRIEEFLHHKYKDNKNKNQEKLDNLH